MIPSDNCYNIIKEFESLRLKAYQDTGGVWTIGWGHTGEEAQAGNEITHEQADNLLKTDVAHASYLVNTLGYELNQNQFDALVSLIYNCGLKRLQSRYPKLLNSIHANPYQEAIGNLWLNTAIKDRSGNELPGLKRRRKLEYELYAK